MMNDGVEEDSFLSVVCVVLCVVGFFWVHKMTNGELREFFGRAMMMEISPRFRKRPEETINNAQKIMERSINNTITVMSLGQ